MEIQNGNSKFIDVIWFNKIGIVLTKDTLTNEYKSYISTGKGFDEKEDILFIMKYGNKYPLESAKNLFPWVFRGEN
jgi:hypothetical protein